MPTHKRKPADKPGRVHDRAQNGTSAAKRPGRLQSVGQKSLHVKSQCEGLCEGLYATLVEEITSRHEGNVQRPQAWQRTCTNKFGAQPESAGGPRATGSRRLG